MNLGRALVPGCRADSRSNEETTLKYLYQFIGGIRCVKDLITIIETVDIPNANTLFDKCRSYGAALWSIADVMANRLL